MTAALRWAERRRPILMPEEQFLWEGAPAWWPVARHVFHVRLVTFYFAALTLLDMLIARWNEGRGWPVLRAGKPTVLTGAACVLILLSIAWATGRTTRYTLTTHRLILQFGVALPATLSVPLSKIVAVSARERDGGSGDIALRLVSDSTIMFAKLWPHARSWRFFRPEPMLRDIDEAASVAALLCRTVAARAPDAPARLPPEPAEEPPERAPRAALAGAASG